MSKEAKTIKMIRESDGKTADVHPDEVSNFQLGGFVKCKPETKKEKPKKEK